RKLQNFEVLQTVEALWKPTQVPNPVIHFKLNVHFLELRLIRRQSHLQPQIRHRIALIVCHCQMEAETPQRIEILVLAQNPIEEAAEFQEPALSKLRASVTILEIEVQIVNPGPQILPSSA
ncbi:unnamed protein product, partial [Linum tenue]